MRAHTGSPYWRLWQARVWWGCDRWSHNWTRYLGRGVFPRR